MQKYFHIKQSKVVRDYHNPPTNSETCCTPCAGLWLAPNTLIRASHTRRFNQSVNTPCTWQSTRHIKDTGFVSFTLFFGRLLALAS